MQARPAACMRMRMCLHPPRLTCSTRSHQRPCHAAGKRTYSASCSTMSGGCSRKNVSWLPAAAKPSVARPSALHMYLHACSVQCSAGRALQGVPSDAFVV